MANCPSCNSPVADGASECGVCGTSVGVRLKKEEFSCGKDTHIGMLLIGGLFLAAVGGWLVFSALRPGGDSGIALPAGVLAALGVGVLGVGIWLKAKKD